MRQERHPYECPGHRAISVPASGICFPQSAPNSNRVADGGETHFFLLLYTSETTQRTTGLSGQHCGWCFAPCRSFSCNANRPGWLRVSAVAWAEEPSTAAVRCISLSFSSYGSHGRKGKRTRATAKPSSSSQGPGLPTEELKLRALNSYCWK